MVASLFSGFHLCSSVFICGLLLLTVRPSVAAEAAIDAAVKDALRAWEVPGVAVAIVRDDKVIYLKGHGVRALDTGKPVTPDTVFPLASCTKAFTTTALAMLADDGKLAWDDPVRKHLPYFRLSDPLADANVTLRDLVTHRTGVGGHDLLWYRSSWSLEERIRRVGKLPLDRPFRSTFMYQSVMFTAAGLAAANAAGCPWDDLVQKRILTPLSMTSASFTTLALEKAADHASPHRRNQQGVVAVDRGYPIEVPDPAGSLNASARDLAQWLRFHLAGGVIDGKRLVSEANLRETHTPQMVQRLEGRSRALHPDTRMMSYGMGWVIQDYHGQQLISHAGAIDGFRAHLTMVPKAKLGLVLLNNLHETRMNLALSNRLVDLLLGLPARDWNRLHAEVVKNEEAEAADRQRERMAKRQQGTHLSRERAAYVGTYEHPAYGLARVALERGELVLRWSSFTCPLTHYHHDTFTMEGELPGQPLVIFALNADGDVATLKLLAPVNVEFRRAAAKEERPGVKR